ncbi:MAG: hypothetical protein NTW38_13410 [Candidatus Aminicenantes bacterium]|nr:hypothetical protein [Candidatus Aminicenantes bacterium]
MDLDREELKKLLQAKVTSTNASPWKDVTRPGVDLAIFVFQNEFIDANFLGRSRRITSPHVFKQPIMRETYYRTGAFAGAGQS